MSGSVHCDGRTRSATHLADGNEDHLRAALVLLPLWLARKEARDVRDDDRDVPEQLARLLLLAPRDDVAQRKHARVALDLERGPHLHETGTINDARAERRRQRCLLPAAVSQYPIGCSC